MLQSKVFTHYPVNIRAPMILFYAKIRLMLYICRHLAYKIHQYSQKMAPEGLKHIGVYSVSEVVLKYIAH